MSSGSEEFTFLHYVSSGGGAQKRASKHRVPPDVISLEGQRIASAQRENKEQSKRAAVEINGD